jgi:transposase
MTTESDSLTGILGSADAVPKAKRRLKHYPLALKHRIVEETFGPGQSVSVVARRHDVNANLVFEWRKQYRRGTLGKGKRSARLGGPDLIRVGVVGDNGALHPLPVANAPSLLPQTTLPQAPTAREPRSAGIIEVEMKSGIKVRVDAGIEEGALRRVLAAVNDLA